MTGLMPPALLDTNVLVHAAYRDAPHHAVAARLVARGLHNRGTFCITPQNPMEFAVVVTRARHVAKPLRPDELLRMTNTLYSSRLLGKIYRLRGTVPGDLRDGA